MKKRGKKAKRKSSKREGIKKKAEMCNETTTKRDGSTDGMASNNEKKARILKNRDRSKAKRGEDAGGGGGGGGWNKIPRAYRAEKGHRTRA